MRQRHYHQREGRGVFRNSVPYRARRGIFLGVCRGLARHFDFSVTGMRLLFIVGAFLTGFWPIIAGYLLAALLMPVEPIVPLTNDIDAEFYNSYAASRKMALLRLRRSYDHLERRIQRIETTVTSRDYDWERRLNGED